MKWSKVELNGKESKQSRLTKIYLSSIWNKVVVGAGGEINLLSLVFDISVIPGPLDDSVHVFRAHVCLCCVSVEYCESFYPYQY